ncbi:MAG: DUF4332 domain-containing protein, partial [Roseimicrobium sp.]
MNALPKFSEGPWSAIPGLTNSHVRLLHAAGVPSLAELAEQDAAQLWRWLREVNSEDHVVEHLPPQ